LLGVVKIICRECQPCEVVFIWQMESAHLLVRGVSRIRWLVFKVVERKRVVYNLPALLITIHIRVYQAKRAHHLG
jgi:hypothetical protein